MEKPSAIVANIFKLIEPMVKEGVAIRSIDDQIGAYIEHYKCMSAPIEKGFPNFSCISVNDTVCHGVVNDYILKKGDVVSIDISLSHEGFYGDSCVTFIIEPISIRQRKLLLSCYEALWKSIAIVRPGIYTGDIGHICEQEAKSFGFGVIKEFVGHGIGNQLHMDPEVPGYGKPGTGDIIKEGMCFTIEPMFTQGSNKIYIENDGWSVKTKDGQYAVQFEHTIQVTKNGCKVLTYNYFDEKMGKKPLIESVL